MAVDQAPFDDVRVRQAMRLILNREEMVQRVLVGSRSCRQRHVRRRSTPATSHEFPQREQDIEAGAWRCSPKPARRASTIDLFAPDDTAGLPELIAVFAEQATAAGVTVNAQVLDGGTYWGEEYTKRTFATSFWGTPAVPQPGRRRRPADGHLPGDPLAAGGQRLPGQYDAAVAETDDAARCVIIEKMQQRGVRRRGVHHPVLQQPASTRTPPRSRASSAQPNMLNLDHFGRGFKNIWLRGADGALSVGDRPWAS